MSAAFALCPAAALWAETGQQPKQAWMPFQLEAAPWPSEPAAEAASGGNDGSTAGGSCSGGEQTEIDKARSAAAVTSRREHMECLSGGNDAGKGDWLPSFFPAVQQAGRIPSARKRAACNWACAARCTPGFDQTAGLCGASRFQLSCSPALPALRRPKHKPHPSAAWRPPPAAWPRLCPQHTSTALCAVSARVSVAQGPAN